MHKKKMDEKFHKNQLKPGDAGFEYDKRIDFTKKPAADTSWDEGDVDNYFDDDFM
jgi:centrosomal protein CEP19